MIKGVRASKQRRPESPTFTGPAAPAMVIHRKMRVGAVADPAEREADRLAEEVTRWLANPQRAEELYATDPAISRVPVEQAVSRVRRAPAPDPASDAGGTVGPGVEREIKRVRRFGAPLPAAARHEMASAFGTDFGRVRINTGADADRLCRSVSARAFTVEHDVFFAGREFQPSTDSGRHLLAHELAHTLQDASPVSRVVRREPGETEGTEEAEGAELEDEEAGEGIVLSGSIPASVMGGPTRMSTAPPEGLMTDGAPVGRRGTSRMAGRDSPDNRDGYRVEVGSCDVTATETRVSSVPAESSRDNSVKVGMTATASTSSGAAVTPFGGCNHDHDWGVPTYTVATKKKDKVVTINFTVKNDNQWGTNDGGNTDVPSADSPVVTADNYNTIVSDLTPKKKEKSWVAPRTAYWSKSICERHEKYHAKDSSKWTLGQGKKFVVDYLKKKKIAISNEDLANGGTGANTKIANVVTDARDALDNAWFLYMRGTTGSYYSYPCEERAFGDGQAPYLKLAAAVKKRGKVLEKQKRAAEKKAVKSGAKGGDDSGGGTDDGESD